MKKFTLFAGLAAVAFGASAADFNVADPSIEAFANKHGKGTYFAIAMSELSMDNLKAAGNEVVFIGPDEVTNFLYVWDNTFNAGTTSIPGPGWNEDIMDFEYTSLTVGTVGWSGCGWFNTESNFAFDDNTIFHVAYATTATSPGSIGVLLLDGRYNEEIGNDKVATTPAKIGVGGSYNDNGAIFPGIGSPITEDWAGVEISFADIKKLYPSFAYKTGKFNGNVVSVLAGGVTGQNFAVDNMFFFVPGNAAIEGVGADVENAPVEYFNLQGVRVANPENGLFIRRQGNKAEKLFL